MTHVQTITPNEETVTHSSDALLRQLNQCLAIQKMKPRFDRKTDLEKFMVVSKEWQQTVNSAWDKLASYPTDYCIQYEKDVTANGKELFRLVASGEASSAKKSILAYAKANK